MNSTRELAPLRTKPVSALLVEDDPEDALILRRLIADADTPVSPITHCETLHAAGAALRTGSFDIVLLDLDLPDGDGLTFLPQALSHGSPVLVLTGRGDSQSALRAVRHGAQDYLSKHELTAPALVRAIGYAIERHKLRAEVLAAHEREQAMKDDVLSHVSHELRTPLTAVSQFVGIIRDAVAGPLTHKQDEYLGIIQRNVQQLKRMIGDLMDVARVNTGKLALDMDLVDVKACVADVLDAAAASAAEKGIEIVADLGSAPRVLADQSRVTQVLQNLVDNAVKFTQTSGRVQVQARVQGDQLLAISVIDNGPGIEPALLERLFERLQQGEGSTTGSRRGLGLGLWLAKELVTSMGGELKVASGVGKGSHFTFTLPVYSIERLVTRVAGTDASASLALLHLEVRPALPRTGCTVESARREAVRCVQRCIVAATDALLPETASGPSIHVFALARTNAVGAEAIRQRLCNEFQKGSCRLRKLGFHEVVRATILANDACGTDPLSVAERIRQHIAGAN